jgi:molybdopterin-containing oxidoreductase family membrane subunit
MAEIAKPFARPRSEEHEDPREHLMHDPLPRGQMNAMVMEAMHSTSPIFWVVSGILAVIVLFTLGYEWYVLIMEGQGTTGELRPDYWGVFLVNTVFWIGISHAGTFISAILRVLKVESRRPFTRAAELMTTFGLVQAGLSVFMHLGRVWLTYWMFPLPNQRTIWPDFHSPLMWDLMAITTYLLCSTMYLFLPLIPDLAMARDRTPKGPLSYFYRALALGFRGTEGEWKNLVTAMNIFAFAIIPVMFSVHTIVSWDFAMASRPGWSSTVFGPYFVIGALHSGMAAVAIVLFLLRSTMKNYKYFLRPEHFNTIGMLMLLVSMAWGYFYFNDYIVPWYGGDVWDKLLQEYTETGPQWYLWYIMLFCNTVVPWAILWNKKWRQTPWLLAIVGILINIGMYLERYLIIPVGVTITRMPFTWHQYYPRIEIPMTVGTFALFLLLYMLASRVIPLVPVWEVQEGQEAHAIRKVGKAQVTTLSDLE